ncbi:unnamed protein product [Blepharisma stoltei]|uniref:1-phosphatidylinositol-3-phosphate 5-kinase n=1 Tax=Blepharisma stoltei TaxID=1481888 RepID=A0AAU9J5L1_9CILI|nr:unnamed protein product [Blepharisma stoltei]
MASEFTILNREFWMPDYSGKTCFKCEKPFNAVRRRHHCRYCGLIFCANCSSPKKQLENGNWIYRSCEKCLVMLQTPRPRPSMHLATPSMTSPEILLKMNEDSKLQESSELKSKFIEIKRTESKVKDLLSELTTDYHKGFNEYSNEFLETRAQALLLELGINQAWESTIIKIVKQIVSTLCPSIRYRQDAMSIASYLKFVLVKYSDDSLTKYINGVIIKKNTANKRMTKAFDKPKLLILSGSADFGGSEKKLVAMHKLVDQEENYTKIMVKKIKSMGPNIILIENSMPLNALNELISLNIATFVKVKLKDLELVARCTLGKVLNSLDQSSNTSIYLGDCGKFFVEAIGKENYAHFIDPEYPTLVSTIILSGPSIEMLKKIKIAIKRLSVEYRNIRIERSFLIQGSVNVVPHIFINFYATNADYKMISVCQNKICHKTRKLNLDFYGKNDRTLGEFLSNASKTIDDLCEYECGQPLKNHVFYYIKGDRRAKLVISKSNSGSNDEIVMTRACKHCKKLDECSVLLSKATWEYSFHKFIYNFFIKVAIFGNSLRCHHDFYSSRFIFYLSGARIFIEREENPIYELVPQLTSFEYASQSLESDFNQLKSTVKSVLDQLDHIDRDLREKIKREGQEEETEWDVLREKANSIKEAIDKTTNKLMKSQLSSYPSQLCLENYKRSLFFKCCDIKVQLETTINNILRIKLGYKLAEPETIRIREMAIDANLSLKTLEEPTSVFLSAEPFSEKDAFLDSPSFKTLRNGAMTLPLGQGGQWISVEEKDRLSIVAYTLNSISYHQSIINKEAQEDFNEYFENELLSTPDPHFVFEVSNYEEAKRKEDLRILYGERLTITVTVYFAKKFEALRKAWYGLGDEFLQSIIRSERLDDLPGKRRSFISHDKRFILKVLSESEFAMFLELAPNYFRHMYKHCFKGMPSRLMKTVGGYKIKVTNHSTGWTRNEYLILMQYLRYQMPEDSESYDLKGVSKYCQEKGKVDLSFLEDFRGLPICLNQEMSEVLNAGIWNDTILLAKQNIIDYSLLLVVSKSEKKVAAAIMDYFQLCDLNKAITGNALKEDSNPPLLPLAYKERFRLMITQGYFCCAE